MIPIKTEKEIEFMRKSNRIVAQLLQEIEAKVIPGISTYDLDRFAEEFIRDMGGTPAFKGYVAGGLGAYPASICASVNSCIVHGIPSRNNKLKEGDILGIDVGVCKNGYYGDAARTYAVGKISRSAEKLMEITQRALKLGIDQARSGARVGDISAAIGDFVISQGYFIADSLTGHGIGTRLHEEPIIPNIGLQDRGPRLKKGMTLAIEPMVNIGTNRVTEKGWEFFVLDGTLSAHFEHTVLVTDDEPEILTLYLRECL